MFCDGGRNPKNFAERVTNLVRRRIVDGIAILYTGEWEPIFGPLAAGPHLTVAPAHPQR